MNPPSPHAGAGARGHVPSITRWFEKGLGWLRLGRLEVPHAVAHLVAGPLVVAVFLASASTILDEYASAAVWLDVPLFRIAGLWREDPDPEILVLRIGSEVHASEFGGKTPIPREPFRKLLAEIQTTFKPAVLAVDYDLSPDKDELTPAYLNALRQTGPDAPGCKPSSGADLSGRAALDCYLSSLGGTVLLIGSLPVPDDTHCVPRDAWQEWLKRRGVVFTAADLVMLGSYSMVSKYERKRPESLATRAYCTALVDTKKKPDVCVAGSEALDAVRCETFAQLHRTVDKDELRMLNFPGARTGVLECRLVTPKPVRTCKEKYPDRKFRAVFVGADHDWGDQFNTPMGVKAGVTLHAYTAYSMKHPLTAGHHWDFLVDVVVGVLAGVFFHWSWGNFSLYGLARRLRRALLSLAGLVAAFLAVVVLTPLFAVWANPTLTLVGLFVKSWHTSVHQASVAEQRRTRAADRSVAVVYCVAWTGALLWALFIIVKHSLHG